MDSMDVGLNMGNLSLLPHQIFVHHRQQPNNLLSLPHQIFDHHRQQQQHDHLLSLPHQIFNHGSPLQHDNLLPEENGVAFFPPNRNHHHHRQQFHHRYRRNYIPRLDADNIPYEQLLELQERIGSINTGLSEEKITTCLRTRTVHHHVSTSTSTSGDLKNEEIFNETCIVCQDEYKDNDTIGTLKCGHEYHRDCIKEWLLLKNVCPICKRPALTTITT